jgi:hypothetical protein
VEAIIEESWGGSGAERLLGLRLATRSRIAATCSGVVPQQPPTMPDAVALDPRRAELTCLETDAQPVQPVMP